MIQQPPDKPSLSTDEKRALAARLLRERKAARRAPACLHRLIEEQAAKRPEAVALTFEGMHATYEEVNARANRLARRLRSLGVAPETPVAIYAERSLAMVVGLLAALKAGGAYVPLDPAYPAERLAFILADAKAPVLLTTADLRDRLPAHAATVVDLDDPCTALEPANLEDGATPDGAAYIIYTSGSTGRPKGVVVTHANATHLMAATQSSYQFSHNDVWTLFHSFAFDFSVWEIWGALLFGGRLVVVPYWVSRSPEAFLALLREEGVTVLNQTPSAFRQLIRADETQGKPGDLALRLVIFGGEALEPRTLRSWFERHGDETPQLVNMYGITETTVHVTYRPLTLADCDASTGASPIGRAIPGWRVHVLDPEMQPVPPGVVGEIFVGGQGLARGYLDRPGLTAERFVPDPFAAEPGARLYRSGDLARRRADGQLEYVGRSDHQVKIRGFRIELGEIEAALAAHADVREAVVLARDEPGGDRRLVAYVVGRPGASPAAGTLRDWLRPRLPDYMIPAAFVVLDALPLTTNGKVDRDALPAPDASPTPSERPYEAPRTATERAVAAAWAEVLQREQVGATDDFFELGGHSLLATQVVSRLRNALGRDVPLRWLFETPGLADLAARIDGGEDSTFEHAIIPRVDRSSRLPLSFAQEALWFLDQLDPGRTTFNVTGAARLTGPLDEEALASAFASLAGRHEALRTTFALVDGRPVQVIAPDVADAFEVVDLTGLPEDERPAEAHRLAVETAREPFDLAHGPLARVSLLRLAADDHVVILAMHHIVTDGWSFAVAARELAAFYEAHRTGSEAALPPLPIGYADFSAWQRDRLRDETLDELLAYWTSALRGVPPLEMPTDRPRPAVRRAPGGLTPVVIPPPLAEALRALGRHEGTTPFMTLLAAFQVWLHRWSGQADFAVGSPVAGRNRAELEGLVGYFVNMLVLRADLSESPTFRTVLGRVRREALGAYEHQDLPLELLVEALQPGRDLSRTPVFQAMFVFQNNERPDLGRDDLTLSPLEGSASAGAAKFDLSLVLADEGPAIAGTLEYDADLWDASTADRMIACFLVLLEGLASDPDRPVAALPLVGGQDHRRLLDLGTGPRVDRPAEARVHRMFEASARRTPAAPALMAHGRVLTYAELNARANRLAHALIARGVEPGVLVGLCVERTPAMAAGILGVLKAGGAYVPLDPAYPRDRLAAMLADAKPALLLADRATLGRLPDRESDVLLFDESDLADQTSTDPDINIPADAAAYVIYTSGSTGEPRGVVVTHGGLANHALAAVDLFGLTPADRVAQFASLSFDIAVEELFPTWAAGAAVVLRGGDETLEPAAFARWVEASGVTMLDLPTAYWHAWVDDLAARGLRLPESLRIVVVGGERALPASYAAWRRIGGERVRWVNTYGPTETTVIATADEPAADDPDLPIGRPIANARVYVLDPGGQPVPIGLPGELWIGGAGVSQGYLNRPEATAERFAADPFAGDADARMFRTGDRVRWRADGRLEFLGRFDDQVKIRGFRVEPGEVEAAIRALPGVSAAAVVVRRGASGDGRLEAFAVTEAAPESIARRLRETLPRHMVPGVVTPLDALPLTPSGKVDRQALLALASAPAPTSETAAPRDAVEARLVGIWEDVLGVRPVGIRDGFFDLGGHSLLAIRLLARVEEAFGRRLPLTTLFLQPTVADLAGSLREPEPRAEGSSPLVTIQPAGTKPGFFCVHPAGGIVYCFRELAQRLGGERPFRAFQSPGLEGGPAGYRSIEQMASAYVSAIREVQPTGPYHLGGWSLGGVTAYEMARQIAAAGGEVGVVAILDAQAPGAYPAEAPEAIQTLAAELAELGLLDGTDPRGDARVMAAFAGDLGRGFGFAARRVARKLRAMEPSGRLAYLLRVLHLDQVYHLENDPERTGRLWAVLRANLAALVDYRPGPYAGPVVVLRAADGVRGGDPALGWGRLVDQVNVHTIPGDHAGILRAPGVQALAEALRGAIGAREGGA